MNIRKNKVNVLTNNNYIRSIDLTETTTAVELAADALVTISEAQALLDTRIILDTNNICCDGILPIINTSTYTRTGSGLTRTFNIITDIVNTETDIFNIVVSNNNIEILNYTGNVSIVPISNLIFPSTQPFGVILDHTQQTINCAGTITLDQTTLVNPDYVFGNSGGNIVGPGGLIRGTINTYDSLADIPNFNLNFSPGVLVELRYYIDGNEYLDIRTVSVSTSTIINFTQPISFTGAVIALYPTKLELKNVSTNYTFEFGNDVSYVFTI